MRRKRAYDFCLIAVGCFIAAASVNVFLLPNKISSGGISGIGNVLNHVFGIKMSVASFVLNGALFLVGYKRLGRKALIKTACGAALFSAFLELTATLPTYTESELISSVSGGFLMGLGTGLTVRAGASTGGSDFAAMMLKRKAPHISLAALIMFTDTVIVAVSGVVFKSFTVTFYSVAALFVCSVMNDKMITAGEEAKALLIFSEKQEKIAEEILKRRERGLTGIHGVGMYENKERLMLLCVVTPKEAPIYLKMIKETDGGAFIVIQSVRSVIGEGFCRFESIDV